MNRISQLFKSTPILITLSICFIYFEYHAPYFFSKLGGAFDARTLGTLLFFVAYTWIFFFAMPATVGNYIFKENLRDLGLRFPEQKIKALFLIIVALIILIPILHYLAQLKQFRMYYSIGNTNHTKFFFMQITLFPIYYVAEEFFFRGFLFLTLWKKVKWHSFWITDIIFTCAHLGKPPLEIVYAIPASIVLCALTLNTRSIYPAIFVHSTVGILLIYFINY